MERPSLVRVFYQDRTNHDMAAQLQLVIEAQKTITSWIDFYNNERQHLAQGYQAQAQFRIKQAA